MEVSILGIIFNIVRANLLIGSWQLDLSVYDTPQLH